MRSLEVAPTSASAPSGLVVAGLTKRYGNRTAVQDLSFEVARGEILALLGPNGAGKTTTLMCCAGLLRPHAGRFWWNGTELGTQRGRQIALIPEYPDVFEMLTVWEHMAFVARTCRLGDGWQRLAWPLLDRLQLAEERDALGEALSKGMRQKLLVASAVLAGAPVLLLDEPMVGLDPRGQRELRQILLRVRQEGTAVVVSTHLLENVQSFCDRLVILDRGRCVASGQLEELLRRYGRRSLEEAFFDIVEAPP